MAPRAIPGSSSHCADGKWSEALTAEELVYIRMSMSSKGI